MRSGVLAMALTRCKLGEHIELVERPNTNLQYGIEDVRGVNNLKLMIRTKADVSARKFDKFQIVLPGEFFFNHRTSRNGDKFSVTFNYDSEPHIVTEDYVVFTIKNDGAIDPMWLYMYLSRPEFDRYVIQNSWGSSTEFYNWEDLCDVDIALPPIEVQRSYAAVYEALWKNLDSFADGVDDLKVVCDASIEKLLAEAELVELSPYIHECDLRNGDEYDLPSVRGISVTKKFIPTKAKMDGVSLASYKCVKPGQIAFVTVTSRNSNKITIAMNDSDETYIVSATYIVFATDLRALLPEYLMLIFNRSEFDRYARFNSWGSARETFNWEDMRDVRIPLPSIDIQKSIANVYLAYVERKRICEELSSLLRTACPVLVRGSFDEARR